MPIIFSKHLNSLENFSPATYDIWWLTLQAPTPQNGQTYSNNSSVSVFDHFVRLALKGLN